MGKPKEDSGTWLMTYGDLMTLLLVFFVLLYTMTPGVEEQAFNSFITYFQQHSGFLPDNSSVTTDLQNNPNPEQVDEIVLEQMERWQNMSELIENITANMYGLDIEVIDDGLLITLADSVSFLSGSSSLLPQAEKILDEVTDLFTDGNWDIEVQGHTDNVPVSSDGIHQTNWHLGAARAVSVLQYLQDKTPLNPTYFKATSFGEHRPVATNNTPEGRRSNRRVEIYLKDQTVQLSEKKSSNSIDESTLIELK